MLAERLRDVQGGERVFRPDVPWHTFRVMSGERRIGPEDSTLDVGSRPREPSGARTTWLQPGVTLAGRYELLAPLGEGGMGHVWRARQLPLGRVVALKVLHRDRAADPTSRERFRREAMAAAELDHPGLVRTLDFGLLGDGREFIAMELVEGRSLADLLAEHGPMPWRQVVRIGVEVADALAHAHRSGFVHRDVKPANVMIEGGDLEQGRVKLLDLGIARRIDGPRGDTLTAHGVALGTPRYAAPEQLRGERVTPASDLYALGALLYRALSGRPPYDGRSFAEVAEAQRAGPPPRPSTLAPEHVPAVLDRIVLSLLAIDPQRRPAGADGVASALRYLVSRKRWRRMVGTVAMVALGALLGAGALWWLAF